MTANLTTLRRQIASADDLKSVVRTTNASAAQAIGQYERSVTALADYAGTVEIGLGQCLRSANPVGAHTADPSPSTGNTAVHAIVFGSDQGLVGRFNEAVVEHPVTALASSPTPTKTKVWAVGERAHARLLDADIVPEGALLVPGSVKPKNPRTTGFFSEQVLVLDRCPVTSRAPMIIDPATSLLFFHVSY
jgi:F-type H+-transporting ATPase subunit gamma